MANVVHLQFELHRKQSDEKFKIMVLRTRTIVLVSTGFLVTSVCL